MTELLTELKDACQRASSTSDDEAIALGESTWIRGLPANAEEGTIALSMGREATIVIREGDIRAVRKEANVLLRIEKPLKATVERGCGCKHDAGGQHARRGRRPIDLEIGPITVTPCVLCAEVVIDNGKQSVLVEICIPVPCEFVAQ